MSPPADTGPVIVASRGAPRGSKHPAMLPQASEPRKLPLLRQQGSTRSPHPALAHPAAELTVFHPLPPTTSQAQPPSSSCSDEGRGQRPRLVSPTRCLASLAALPSPPPTPCACDLLWALPRWPTLGSRPCSDVTSWQRPLTQRCPACDARRGGGM